MRRRYYERLPATKTRQGEDEDRKRRHRPEDSGLSTIPPDFSGAVPHSTTRALRQQAILQMQQTHGNAAVRRYLAGRGVLPATAIQREPAQGQDKGETKDKSSPKYVVVVSIVGEKQGTFKGTSKIPGYEGMIEGSEFFFSMHVSSSKTTAHTDNTGPYEVRFHKELDEGDSQLLAALKNDESLKSATFVLLHRDADDGKLKPQRTFNFSAGKITDAAVHAPEQNDPHGEHKPAAVAITIQFQKAS